MELKTKGKRRGGDTLYTEIARNRGEWDKVADVKEFDTAHTSIIRVFRHKTSPIVFVYASHSTDGKTAKEAFELDTSDAVAVTVAKAAAAVGCKDCAAKAVAQLA